MKVYADSGALLYFATRHTESGIVTKIIYHVWHLKEIGPCIGNLSTSPTALGLPGSSVRKIISAKMETHWEVRVIA